MHMKKLCLVIQNNCTSVSSIIWKRFVSASSVLPNGGEQISPPSAFCLCGK